jgi:hypothetical protein
MVLASISVIPRRMRIPTSASPRMRRISAATYLARVASEFDVAFSPMKLELYPVEIMRQVGTCAGSRCRGQKQSSFPTLFLSLSLYLHVLSGCPLMPCTKMMLLDQLAPALRKDFGKERRNTLGFWARGLVDDTAGVAVARLQPVDRDLVKRQASRFGFKHIGVRLRSRFNSLIVKWCKMHQI